MYTVHESENLKNLFFYATQNYNVRNQLPIRVQSIFAVIDSNKNQPGFRKDPDQDWQLLWEKWFF